MKLDSRLDALQGKMAEVLKDLCTFEAIAPESGGKGELPKAKYLEGLCRKLGFSDTAWVNSKDPRVPGGERPNLIVRLPGKTGKRLWFLSHLDVVPPGDLAEWKTDPFKPVLKNKKTYGRGAADNNQAIVATLFALKALKDCKTKPKRQICLAFVCDEETGSTYGIKHLIQKKMFRKSDFSVVPDAGNAEGTLIEVAEKSILWLKFVVKGKQAHASTPEKGINAAYAGAQLAVKLKDSLYGKFNKTDLLFEPPFSTFEPTKREQNVPNVNTIPASDVFYLDCRVLPHYRLTAVLKEIKKIVKEAENKTKAKISFKVTQKAEAPAPTNPNHPLVSGLKRAIREVYGMDAYAGGIGGGTFAAYLRKKGIAAVCWEKVEDVAHAPNEYSVAADMLKNAKVFARLMSADL